MKFFWKLFLSIVLINVTFFSIGTYYLIDSNFSNALAREVNIVYNESDILIYTLSGALKNSINEASNQFSEEAKKEWIKKIVRSRSVSRAKRTIPFRISDDQFNTIYNSNWPQIDTHLLTQLPTESRGYEIIQLEGQSYIHVAAPIDILEEKLYIENYMNISHLFENRRYQFNNCFYLIIIVLIVSGGVAFAVSSWLVKPILQLSKAAKRFASGHLAERIEVKSQDEIGLLTEDFNKMAEELEEKVETLKEVSERQESFVGSFAHEIKTPLTSIIGYADRLRSKKMDEEQVILSANYIYEEGKRLEALAMKLLELIVIKKQSFTFQSISSETFIHSIADTMRPIFESREIKFNVSCETSYLEIEPDLMKTACINLLDNANKAVARGGAVSLIGEKSPQGYKIIVRDNGRGMPAEEIAKVTEPFYMIDKSRSRLQGGAGLGLAICLEIIKLHEGKLSFESKLGEGTSITIELGGLRHHDSL